LREKESITLGKDTEVRTARKMTPTLLVIDIQNEFLPNMADNEIKMTPERINGTIWLFRQRRFPVIRIYHTYPDGGPKPDSPGIQFLESVNVNADDPQKPGRVTVAEKPGDDLPLGTLNSILKQEGLKEVRRILWNLPS
jgi:nicotinamidase-related amidase